MKPILLLVGALIAAVVVGCGPAVGRAVGDTDTAAGSATANIDVNVGQQLPEPTNALKESTDLLTSQESLQQIGHHHLLKVLELLLRVR